MLSRKEIEAVKAKYTKGMQIELVEMRGEERMERGLKGIVESVDDIGQIHVSWENGGSLALNIEEDTFNIVKTYEQKVDAYLEKLNEVLGKVNLMQLNISVNGHDVTLAHDTLAKMQEAFEAVYGTEPVGAAEEYILLPAVFRGRMSGVMAVGLVMLDLQSSGEHCESTFLTSDGAIHQSQMQDNPEIAKFLKEFFIPYDYWYTAAVENDIHVDFEHIPEEVQKLAGDVFRHELGGSAMKME